MWQTLQPNPVKVNVVKLMVEFWIYQRDKVPKGSITIGGFVSVLAKRIPLPLPQKSICGGFALYDVHRFKQAHFLDIKQTAAGERYLWLREQGTDFYLPYPHKVNLSRPDLWIIPEDYTHPLARRHSISEGRVRSRSTPMEIDPRVGSHSPPPHFNHGDSSHMPSWAKKLTKMVSKLTKIALKTSKAVKKVKREQGRLSTEIEQYNRRLDNVANIVYDNDFYNRYGYWPGGDEDPNMVSDEAPHSADSSATPVASHPSVAMSHQPLGSPVHSIGSHAQREEPQPEPQIEPLPLWRPYYQPFGTNIPPPTMPHPWSEYPPQPRQADSDPSRYQSLAPQQPAEFEDPFGIFPTYSLQ